MRAWMIQWRHSDIDDPAKNQPVTFVNPRFGAGAVARIVEALYSLKLTLRDRASAAKQGGHVPWSVRTENNQVTCGHNPWLWARKVKDIEFEVDPDTEQGVLRWTEIPLFVRGPDGLPVEERGDLKQSIAIMAE